MKKAAEVDFTWAAFARTYEKKALAAASRAKGVGLETLGHLRLYDSRAFHAIGIVDVVMTAKQTSAS